MQETEDQIGEVSIYQDTGYRRSNRRGKYTRIQDTEDQIGEVSIPGQDTGDQIGEVSI